MPIVGPPLDAPIDLPRILDLGLEPGDRIASLMPNRTELIVHYLA